MKKIKSFAMLLLGLSIALASCEKEPESVPVTGITLDSSSLTLTEGESAKLSATISPSNADNQAIIWSTSNASIASVNNGTVTAVAAGTATITAKSDDGGKTATCNVTVSSKIVHVESVSLDKTSIELTEGDEYTLFASVQPSNASNQSVSWSSSDNSVASVDNGKVKAIKAGTATITVTTSDGNKTAKCEVKVNEKIYHVESVSLDKTSIELTEGDEYTLYATVIPENATDKSVSWSSSDDSIASVENGKITALRPGNAVITVTTSDGNKTAKCEVKVNEKIYHVESVSLDKTSLELTEGDEYTLNAAVLPENAKNKAIIWSSSDNSIATVADGLVKAIKPGVATITATSEDGNKTAKCEVCVKEKIYHVESVSLDKTSLELTEGDEYTLYATVLPENATDKSITWSSSDSSIATIDKNGKVSAIKVGTAIITASSNDSGKMATCSLSVTAFQPEMVDLGLSVKWANCNLGASSPEEYGDYYAWGEIETKTKYTLENYKFYKSGDDGNGFIVSGYTKYVSQENADSYGFQGFYDDKTTLDKEDDVAHVKLGMEWRMPTGTEIDELINNCKCNFVTYNGVKGMKFTSKKEGYTDKWIFLPAAGYCSERFYHIGQNGYVWSSSPSYTNGPQYAYTLLMTSDHVSKAYFGYVRYVGQSVRPVCDK